MDTFSQDGNISDSYIASGSSGTTTNLSVSYPDSYSYYDLYISFMPSHSDFVPEEFSATLKILLAVSYSVVACGAVLGNACVLLVILGTPTLRTFTNTFIVSLAASDALIAIWNIPLQLLSYLRNDWILGEAMCKATSYIQGISILASILTLTAISVERYYVICNPIQAHCYRSTKTAVLTVICVWLAATLIMMPQLWIQRLQQRLAWQQDHHQPIKIVHLCVEYFPTHAYNVAYSYGHVIIFYLTPIAIMTYAYGRMTRVLWLKTSIEAAIASVEISDRRECQKRGIVRMLMVIVVCFTVCWFPFFTIHIIQLHCHLTTQLRITQAFAMLSGYTNSFLNPILYFFLNAEFNRVVRKIIPGGRFLSGKKRSSVRYASTRNTATHATLV